MKNKGGRPAFKPSTEQREEVRTLSKYGVRQDTIAAALGLSVNTLKKHFEAELTVGRAQGDIILQETQFQRAVRDGDVSMLRWLGIHRLGQVEKQELSHTSPDGSMTPKPALDVSKLSTAALAEIMAATDAAPDK